MQFIIGNWKMNGTRKEKDTMTATISRKKTSARVILCLPFTLLSGENHGVLIGAQDISEHDNGAYTGDISGKMIAETGAKYVIVGHSERRSNHDETNKMIKTKAENAIKNKLIPIICIGETLAEHKSGATKAVITKMMKENLPISGKFIVAYEPRWAIGTGLTPTPEQTAQIINMIYEYLKKHNHGTTPIVYGGSINATNAKSFISIPHINGLLIGGASLKTKTFLPIIDSIS
ncbi:MAG: triose-phosphate isomerase [Alphaproteobacteria bacterium]|nr:triose-phosphate isomerase [Alphaproteobacteria bacterium]